MRTRRRMLSGRQSYFIVAAALLAGCTGGASHPTVSAAMQVPDLARADGDSDERGGPAIRPEQAAKPLAVAAQPASATPPSDDNDRVVVTGKKVKWSGGFQAYLKVLRDTSCPAGVQPLGADPVSISAAPVPLQPLNPSRRRVGELTFVAGYHLTSTDARFGGLSGIEVLDDGNLLAVSDHDTFVWIDLGADGVTPVAARIAPMHAAQGANLDSTVDGGAEGLAWNAGMAMVSYNENQRVLAYDIGKCGAAARGAPIVFGPFGLSLPEAYDESGVAVNKGSGSESLALTSDWYLFTGIETKVGNLSPMSARPVEADPDFSLRVGVDAQEFVGLDLLPQRREGGVRAFTLHRSFSPRAGYAVTIAETDFNRYADEDSQKRSIDPEIDQRARFKFIETGWRELAQIDMLMTIDNFEGIAVKELPDGRTRLFVISDDNFSPTQRTLLMVFDLTKPLH